MKAIDLLKYLELADPAYVAEASDYNLLLYRKRRKRTIRALAACFAIVVLGSIVFAKPALHAWETRNTVTSWNDSLLGVSSKPSPSVMVSAEMPAQKRFAADTPFTLSVGMGQVADYEYATLSVTAYGFEITDKDGNTATDRYVRTLSAFNSGDYGVTYNDRHRVTGCTYLEDFTFRFVGNTKSTGSYPITLSLQSRDESSTMGDSVTVWYTLQNGVLKLTDKNPVKGDQNGNGTVLQPEETEEGTVTLSKEDISIRVTLDPSVLYPGQYVGDNFEITARHKTYLTEYSTDGFTAELIYAETLRKEDFSFPITYQAYEKPEGSTSSWIPSCYLTIVPDDAPIGAYDLRVTDPETGFVWVFENMAMVLPKPDKTDPDSGAFPPYEDLSCAVTTDKYTFLQGESILNAFAITLVQYGEDVSFFCSAELVYAEDGGEGCTITVQDSLFSSHLSASYIPVDAPVGGYDLIVTDQRYGYTWRFNHIVEIIANPDAPIFGLNTNFERKLTISRTSEVVYTFVAEVENLGKPITMIVTPQTEPCPAATLTFAEAPAYAGELFEIPLVSVSTPVYDPYEWTWQTGATVTPIFEIMVTPDTPCGLYDLTLTYEGCIFIFRDAVEIVP